MWERARQHWPEYLMEAAALGIFMLSACVGCGWLEYPASPVHAAIANPDVRRAIMGALMGLTAIGLIYSPWGARSGAHMNPSVTLAFWYLGKISRVDACFYVLAQFVGGIAGVAVSAMLMGAAIADPAINYITTTPGPGGVALAFAAEFGISFGMMLTVLVVSGHPRYGKYTGVCAGILVALFIFFEAPLSGMSMNPARTLGSAVLARSYTAAWLYFLAPPLAMLVAADLYHRVKVTYDEVCAKLHHAPRHRCIHCGHRPALEDGDPLAAALAARRGRW